MQQRAGRRDPQPFTELRRDRFQPVQHGSKIGFPDIAAVDDPQRQHLVRRQQFEQRRQFVTGIDRIHMQAGHRQAAGQRQIVLQRAEVTGQQYPDAIGRQLPVGMAQRLLPVGIQLGHQHRLIDLYPLHALGRQLCQQFGIDRQQAFQQGQPVGIVLGLAQPQIADRADDHRLGPDILCPGFGKLLQQPGSVEPERGIGREFRDDVVVVGIEPLGHFPGRNAGAAGSVLLRPLGRTAACDPEEIVQRISMKVTGPFRQIAQHEAGVEHLVVKGEIADRNQVQGRLLFPVTLAQRCAECGQRVARGLALPVRFECEFQFASGADAGEAEIVRGNHDGLFSVRYGDGHILGTGYP